MARLEDTEKRHNTHMVRTIRVCLYRTRMVRKIVPYAYGIYHTRIYAYGTKYAYGIEQGHSGDLTADFAPVVGNLTPRFVKSPVFPHPLRGWGMKLTSALAY